MIGKDEIASIIEDYDRLKLRVGMSASHSALDICDGAIEEGFPTVAYCQKGREKTYSEYFKTQRTTSGRVRRGMVDKSIVMDSFNDVMKDFDEEEIEFAVGDDAVNVHDLRCRFRFRFNYAFWEKY